MSPRISIFSLVILVVVNLATVTQVDAAILVDETFTYTASDPLAGLNGGTGWSGGWLTTTSGPTILSGSLAYPLGQFGGPSTGNRMGVSDNSIFVNSYRSFSGLGDSSGPGSGPLGGTTLWISLLINPISTSTASAGDGMLFEVSDSSFSKGFTAGFRNDALVWMLGSPPFANETSTGKSVTLAETVKLVFRVDFSGDTNDDRVSMYVNPGLTLPGAPDAMLETHDIGDLSYMFLGNFRAAGDWDEILVSDEAPFQAAAVPEPSTWALSMLGMVGVGICIWRRKWSRCA
ncbi:MAG: PEP-CTERM sorting domain-containing protein [Planctomycetes bacterium]|nr:PEP-CTERM sorting domain-containing protein [Planctomycetota bacterium]